MRFTTEVLSRTAPVRLRATREPFNTAQLEISKSSHRVGTTRAFRLWFAVRALICISSSAPANDEVTFFESKVRPLLIERCIECHGAEKQKGGLRLDSRAGWEKGGDTGSALVPGRPEESLLIKAIGYADEDLQMPPKKQLSADQISVLTEWVRRGAHDPRDGKVAAAKTVDFAEARKFWAFQPVQLSPPPSVQDAGWPRSDVDRFVLGKLEEKKRRPVGDAGPRTFIRRMTFDLTGLPPTPEEIAAFLQCHETEGTVSANAGLADRLLASPHFGERWGRHWLDVARYAENNGRDRNMVWHHAWRYRDWVVAAFNADMPYDRFLEEQIAGDLMPADEAGRDARLVATGFLALGAKLFAEPKRDIFIMDSVDEQIDVITRGVLGLSVACARCHDHKFDPIPTRDYYALAGILRSTQPLHGPAPMGLGVQHDSSLQTIGPDAVTRASAAAQHLAALKAAVTARDQGSVTRYGVVRRVADFKNKLAAPNAATATLAAEIATMETEVAEWDVKMVALKAAVKDLELNPPPQPDFAMGAGEAPQPADCRVHIRGLTTALGESVPRGTLQLLPLPAVQPVAANESGRRQLAEWLAHPANPLTSRVAVNRVWQRLFGRGIVATPDDFGKNGARPSHPELLDFLAARFVADGWSVKRLIRELVLSRTYGLAVAESSEDDPENTLLAWHRPRVLEAEALRDAVLAASGQLVREPRPRSLIAELRTFADAEIFSHDPCLKHAELEHNHRSVYLPIARGWVPEMLKLFDFPDPTTAIGLRDETIVPAQSAFLLNSPWMAAQARHFAVSLLATAADNGAALDALHLRAFARLPTAAERDRALTFVADTAGEMRLERWTTLCHAAFATTEFRFVF